MAGLKYWLWLTSRKWMDPLSAQQVLEHFGTPERAYYAGAEEYARLPVRPNLREQLLDKELDTAEGILEQCDRLGVRIMTCQDGDYPARLRELADPPAVLYIRGRVLPFDEEVAIGVVGTRQPSEYGVRCAHRFGLELARGGALVVSGVAEGLDTCAIRGALSGGGRVVSVLAGGVDVCYPYRNRGLYDDIAATGALISEHPPGTPHRGAHFPARNRLISGLSLGVLAVECRAHSGTILTVNHALDQGRDVFAIPGSIDAPMSEGTNRLIQQGASLVTCGEDILSYYWERYPLKLRPSMPMPLETAQARLEELRRSQSAEPAPKARAEGPEPAPKEETPPVQPGKQREFIPRSQQRSRFTDDQLALLAAMKQHGRTADELVELTQIPARRVLSALTVLQIDAAAEERPGKRFVSLVELEE